MQKNHEPSKQNDIKIYFVVITFPVETKASNPVGHLCKNDIRLLTFTILVFSKSLHKRSPKETRQPKIKHFDCDGAVFNKEDGWQLIHY